MLLGKCDIPMYKVFECPDCHGDGYRIFKNRNTKPCSNQSYRFNREKCVRCRGTGQVKEELG